MSLRKVAASVALAALVVSTTALPALARGNENGAAAHKRISEKFEDMDGFDWGLNQVVKMQVKGIFKGRGQSIFAPGAKITHQEAAVAVVRLMDAEADALALSAAEVDSNLSSMPDQAAIATWARNSVAFLAKNDLLDKSAAFGPAEDATRLYVAVLLVKAMGYEAEAQSMMDTNLPFADAARIPADQAGYVAAAVEHGLINGYMDRTFKPDKAVKRIEMAVMMGRADTLFQRERTDEIKGAVTSVDAANSEVTISTRGRTVTVTVTAEAAIFVDNLEKALVDVLVGMKIEVKLNAEGQVVYLEARTPETDEDNQAPVPATATGTLTALTAATGTETASVSLSVTTGSTTTTTAYSLDAAAVIKINGAAASFANLLVGDSATLTIVSDKVTLIEVTRTSQISGSILSLSAATQTSPATIGLSVTANNTTTTGTYTLSAAAAYTINNQAATLAEIMVGDSASLTLTGAEVTAVSVSRTEVSGIIASLTPATGTTPALIAVGAIVNGSFTMTSYSLTTNTGITVNAQAAEFADLQVNYAATLTFVGSGLYQIAATH